jgi:hypothetical protein
MRDIGYNTFIIRGNDARNVYIFHGGSHCRIPMLMYLQEVRVHVEHDDVPTLIIARLCKVLFIFHHTSMLPLPGKTRQRTQVSSLD